VRERRPAKRGCVIPTAVLLVAQAAATPAPQTAATSASVTWFGIQLGAPAESLRTSLGDPLRVVQVTGDNGPENIARYWVPGSKSTFALVIEARGYVVGFEGFTQIAPAAIVPNVPPDPKGVRLGDTLDSVKANQPALMSKTDTDGSPLLVGRTGPTTGAAYSFENGRVLSFEWIGEVPKDLPALASPQPPSGDGMKTAILDLQQNDADGVAWEYLYLSYQPCANDTSWQLRKQSLLREGSRAYDRLHVFCPPTKAERDFYFDITSYFGKL
jgi:hypothetical protein